jgi:hypothetical protein
MMGVVVLVLAGLWRLLCVTPTPIAIAATVITEAAAPPMAPLADVAPARPPAAAAPAAAPAAVPGEREARC